MLSDPERELLAILRNYRLKHSWMPPLYLLRAKTDRNETGIRKVLQSLAGEGLMDWSIDKSVDSVAPRIGEWWEVLAAEVVLYAGLQYQIDM